ncbi:MAG: hypothetical protein ACC608_11220 [Anaerofustis sp.]
MNLEELKNQLHDKQKVCEYFQSVPNQKIRRLTYFDEEGFGSGTNIYLISKKTCSEPAQALCSAWLNEYLWEEDLDLFDYAEPCCREAADAFEEESAKYRYKEISEADLKQYIASHLEPIIKKTAALQSAEKRPDRVEFLSQSGIYVDRIYTTENAYVFKPNEIYSKGLLLYREKQTKGEEYRELFFETDLKYVYYLD